MPMLAWSKSHKLSQNGFLTFDAPRRIVLAIMIYTINTILVLKIVVCFTEDTSAAICLTLKAFFMIFLLQGSDVGTATSKSTSGT